MGEKLALGVELIPEGLLTDFLIFSEHHLLSRDIDPVYPVLRDLQMADLGFTTSAAPPPGVYLYGEREEEALWWTLVYAAYYKVSSAETLRASGPPFKVPIHDFLRLPTGTERRGHRDARKLRRHLEDILAFRKRYGSLMSWLEDGFTGDPFHDWERVRDNVEKCWGNGGWASYKIADLLQAVHGWRISAPDAGQEHAGPRDGGLLLWSAADGDGLPDSRLMEMRALNLLDEMRERLPGEAQRAGYPRGRIDLNHVETCLCDFHSLHRGRYYVGHDIDAMLRELDDPRITPIAKDRVTEARGRTLPHPYLAEGYGLDPLGKERNKAYRDNGLILVRSDLGTRVANKGTMEPAPTGVLPPAQSSLWESRR